jgi:hypothetical protein
MTGADMIVAAPWIAFGIALVSLCIAPLLSRRASRRHGGRGPSGRQ